MSSTLHELRRVFAIGFWTAVAFVGYIFGLVAVLWLQLYAVRHYGWQPLTRWLPRWIPDWLVTDSLLAIFPIGIAVSALLLGMLGKLPWTTTQREPPGGFPLAPAGPPAGGGSG